MLKSFRLISWVRDVGVTVGLAALFVQVVPGLPRSLQEEKQELKAQLGRIIVAPGSGTSIAIPDFSSRSQSPSSEARSMGRVVYDDLDFSGVANVVSRSLYPETESPADPRRVDFPKWRGDPARADYLVQASLLSSADQILVDMYLFDLQAESQLLARSYRGAVGEWRDIAHTIADDIVRLLSGTDGVSTSKIAFVSPDARNREVYIVDYDGHGQRQFTREQDLVLFPNWAPDGKKIAYVSYKGGRPHIQIRSVTDGLPLGVFRFPSGSISSPVFSPSGDQLAFSSSKDSNSMQLYVADLMSQRIRQLTYIRSVIHTSPRWNPRTGRELAYICDQSGTPQIHIIGVDGSNERRLLNLGGSADSPAWSPDGRYIAFSWRPPGGPDYDVFVLDIASGQIVQLTDGAGTNESPAWSPDGRHLVFQSNRTGRFELYIMHVDGTGMKQITSRGGMSPAWWRRPSSS